MRIRIVVNQIIGHGLDDDGGDLRPARPVEIGHAMTVMDPLERGEGRADFVGRGNGKSERLIGGKSHVVTFHSAVRSGSLHRVSAPRAGILRPAERG